MQIRVLQAGAPGSVSPILWQPYRCSGSTPDVADAFPAEVDGAGGNQDSADEPKVVTVTVATITDALKRSSINVGNAGSGNGVCLRAGTFQTSFDSNGIFSTLGERQSRICFNR